MTVKKELGQTGGKYENTAYQLDFGSAYITETVVNNVPTAKPTKKNLNKAGVNIDGKQVLAGSVNYYKVTADYSQYKGIEADKDRIGKGFYIVDDYPEEAVTINQDGVQVTDSKGQVVKGLKMALYESLDKAPSGVQEALMFEYKFSDDYDETHDDYQSVYQVFAAVDFETSDGQKFKAGDELTKFTSQVVDKAKGKVDISFDDTFLKSILETSEFQAEVYLQMTRIQAGTVENTYRHTVNGVEVVSNTVVTHTPEEVKPEQPKKEEPKSEEPKEEVSKAELPNTGMSSSNNLALLGMAMGTIALALSMRKKKE